MFRLFPCPTRVGIRRVGDPGRKSPVLVTCNFYLTVNRLLRSLKGLDVWLLVAQSKGVNVWCAACGNVFNTRSVVSSIKTSGIEQIVDHRTLILSPLSAPGVSAAGVQMQTGWTVRWGPVRASDLPRYLAEGCNRKEGDKRVTYNWLERIDTGAGALFPLFFLGLLGFMFFGRHLLIDYLAVGTGAFLLFMLTSPWIPGKRGLTKVLFFEMPLGVLLFVWELIGRSSGFSVRADIIIAMAMFFLYGSELGGLAPNMKSELDPFLAKLGVGAIGNVALAGAVRTEILNGYRELTYDQDKCIGCRCCVEVCPVAVWGFDKEAKKAVFGKRYACTACRACLVQCPSGAIQAPLVRASS